MRASERQTQIIELVTERGSLRIDELRPTWCEPHDHPPGPRCSCLPAAHHQRPGAAKVMQSALFETGVRVRLARQAREKEALARAVAAHLEPGQAVMLDDSTTCVYLARLLRGHTPVTVITNFVPVMRELWGKPGSHLRPGRRVLRVGDVHRRDDGDAIPLSGRPAGDVHVAITNLVCYHQSEDTISFKRATPGSCGPQVPWWSTTPSSRGEPSMRSGRRRTSTWSCAMMRHPWRRTSSSGRGRGARDRTGAPASRPTRQQQDRRPSEATSVTRTPRCRLPSATRTRTPDVPRAQRGATPTVKP